MKIDVPDGVLLYCRPCDAEVPHREYRFPTSLVEGLICQEGHLQPVSQPMVSLSYDSTFDPITLMLPRRSWNAAYVKQREQLQARYMRAKKG